MNNKIKILLIGTITVIVIGIVLFCLFGWAEISVEPTNAKATLDKKEVSLPYKRFLLVGKHHLTVTTANSYYYPAEQEIRVKPGRNIINIKLTTKRDLFLKELPIDNDNWNISYTQTVDRLFVTIKTDPVEENKTAVLKFLKSKGIDTTKENIIWNTVAGVGDKVGP